jgi:bacillopeptidase F
MARSRIDKRLVKQTERNLLLIILGGATLLILFVFFGVKLLVNFSLFIEKKTDSSASSPTKNEVLVSPILDPIVSATNSANIDVTGIAGSGDYVTLYINGKQLKKADVKDDNTFAFRNVDLDNGDNTIKAKAFTKDNKESKFSDAESIIFSNKAPALSVDFPTDGETYHKDNNPLKVRGKTDKNIRVTINDLWGMVDDNGNYYYNLPLQNGDNQITVVATDEAGNKTTKTIKVSYSE